MSDISDPTPATTGGDSVDDIQPLRDGDATSIADPDQDPAQIEWDRTMLADAGEETDDPSETATGADPAEIPADEDDIPRDDLPNASEQPETQGADPVTAELGEEGQGDLAPEDL